MICWIGLGSGEGVGSGTGVDVSPPPGVGAGVVSATAMVYTTLVTNMTRAFIDDADGVNRGTIYAASGVEVNALSLLK